MNKKVIVLGAGGHAKVVADIVLKSGDELIGFLDDNVETSTKIYDNYKVLGKIEKCVTFEKDIYFALGIGNNNVRKMLCKKFDLRYYTAIHPSAVIACETDIESGSVIMANAVVNACAHIGKGCIINSAAIIEHDDVLEDFVHISPNATLCGNVKIGQCTHIGASAVVKNNIDICKNTIVGAGAVVVKNIEKPGTYIGVPAIEI